MGMQISREQRTCKCGATFTSVNGHPTCQACMTGLARKFWAAMGCTKAEISKIIIAR